MATAAQIEALARAGCEIVRVATPSVRDAENARRDPQRARRARCHGSTGGRHPLHAERRDDRRRARREGPHQPGELRRQEALRDPRVQRRPVPGGARASGGALPSAGQRCKELGRAMRIGTNHGSLSDRIMNRFGDTPLGMVESALEFLAVCEDEGFFDVVFSMKASNPQVTIHAYRLLAARLGAARTRRGQLSHAPRRHRGGRWRGGSGQERHRHRRAARGRDRRHHPRLPDRGSGEGDSRRAPPGAPLRRARSPRILGTGSGRSLRSRSLPVRAAIDRLGRIGGRREPGSRRGGSGPRRRGRAGGRPADRALSGAARRSRVRGTAGGRRRRRGGDPGHGLRRSPHRCGVDVPLAIRVPAALVPAVAGAAARVVVRIEAPLAADQLREIGRVGCPVEWSFHLEGEPLLEALDEAVASGCEERLVSVESGLPVHGARLLAARLEARSAGRVPIVLHHRADPSLDPETALLRAAADLGAPLCDGIGDLVSLGGFGALDRNVSLAYRILQGARLRTSWTEFISCPSCGRTLFDLEETTARVKERTGHLPGVKIAVMGCIVNGPGEMADADFGYVGSGPGKVNLYAGSRVRGPGRPRGRGSRPPGRADPRAREMGGSSLSQRPLSSPGSGGGDATAGSLGSLWFARRSALSKAARVRESASAG